MVSETLNSILLCFSFLAICGVRTQSQSNVNPDPSLDRSSCKFGYFFSGNQCHECPLDCSRCRGFLEKCPGCSEAQFLNQDTGTCMDCNEGYLWCNQVNVCQSQYILKNNHCLPRCLIPNCKACPTSYQKICSECKSGFSLAQNSICVDVSQKKRLLQQSQESSATDKFNSVLVLSEYSKKILNDLGVSFQPHSRKIELPETISKDLSKFEIIIQTNVPENSPKLNQENPSQKNSSNSSNSIARQEDQMASDLSSNELPIRGIIHSALRVMQELNKSIEQNSLPNMTISNHIQNDLNNFQKKLQNATKNENSRNDEREFLKDPTPTNQTLNSLSVSNQSIASNSTITSSVSNSTSVPNLTATPNLNMNGIPGMTTTTIINANTSTIANTSNSSTANTTTTTTSTTTANTNINKATSANTSGPVVEKPPSLIPSGKQKFIINQTAIYKNLAGVQIPIESIEPLCEYGFYGSGVSCLKCAEKCETCINTANQCLKCAKGWTRIGWKCILSRSVGFSLSLAVPLQNQDSQSDPIPPENINNYFSQIKAELLKQVLPKEYTSKPVELISLYEIKESNGTYLTKGFIEQIQAIDINSLLSNLQGRLSKTDKLGGLVLKSFSLNAFKGTRNNQPDASKIIVAPTKPIAPQQQPSINAAVPVILCLALVGTILGICICRCKKILCFKQENEEEGQGNNNDRGPTERGLRPPTSTELIGHSLEDKKNTKNGPSDDVFEIGPDEQQQQVAGRQIYNSNGLQVMDYGNERDYDHPRVY